ncbi:MULTISPECIES: LacI family DNA-binding transcriptional regulator [unclassified Inquilinus]|uniref:LacI family DNA-binding transcriptional regulator n=1 Tax=unclassified Inquilinus TaxID=2645927 RepID=UPI003F8F745E
MASGRVTIQDIADKLGLSKFSVSRALSGKSGVGEATRNRVLRAAHGMGYRRNHELGTATGQILFIRQEIDPVSSELWHNMLHGAEREGERLGLSIVPRQARHLADGSQLDSAVVGLILAVPRPAEVSGLAARTGLPVVCATYVNPMERIDQVVGADWESGVAVARLLLGLGHRAMAFVHGSTTPLGRAERFRGFRDGALEAEGVAVDDIIFDEEADGFRQAFFAHLKAGGAPTALFCAHDGIAVNVVSELLRLGLRVPEDISVVGFNDFAAASQVSPRLTTVRTPQVEIGAAMVRCIADRLGDAEAAARPPVRLALVAEIVTRASTGPAAGTAWLARILKLAKKAT